MATLVGFTAILMWALLALLTARTGTVPPLQLNAMTFAVGTLVGLVAFKARGARLSVFRQPVRVWRSASSARSPAASTRASANAAGA